MSEAMTAGWWAPVRMGEVRLTVCAGAGPPGWPRGREARLCACAAARHRAEGAVLRPLAPAPGAERAYGLLAAALAADGAAGLLRVADDAAELVLVSLGGALAVSEEATAPEAPGDEELLLARALLRAMPRRLPRREGGGARNGPPAPVLDLGAARLRRRAS